MKNLKQWLENNGVRFVLEEAVTGLEVDGKTIKAMHTSKNSIEADEFIMAAGSWTFPLAKKLGLNIPIQPGKGYSMSITRETNINLPAILTEAKVAVTPMKGFTRFAGTMELSGDNNIILPTRVEAIAKAASNYYSGFTLTPEEKQSATSGLRPVSPDGLPFIGKSSKFKNLNVAAGHAMMGWSLGPITGKLISEIVEGNHTSVLLEPFDLERF